MRDASEKTLGIMIITPVFSPELGGVPTHLNDLIEYLREKDHRVFVSTFQPLMTNSKAPGLEKRKNLMIRRFGWFLASVARRAEENPLFEFICIVPSLLLFSSIFLLRYREEIDVIHGHGAHAAFVTGMLKRMFGKKSVVTLHSTRVFNFSARTIGTRLMRMILSSSDTILVLANIWKGRLIEMGFDGRKIQVFTHWVDHTIFRCIDKKKCKAELGLENRFAVLFVGRLERTKGVQELIGAAKMLNKNKALHFVIVGAGPLAYETKHAAQTSRNITYAGKVDLHRLVSYYNAADIVVVPSFHNEGFCKVVLEALSCGTPVLGSNRGGILESLDDSVGTFIEPEASKIAPIIEKLYRDPRKLAELTSHCRKYSEIRFARKNAKIIENAYRA